MIKRACCLAVTALALAAGAEDENAKWGGELVMWPKDHGSFALVNAQQRVKPEVLGAASANLRRTFLIHFDERTGTAPDVRAAAGEVKRLKAKGAIWIVDDPELPVVLAAAESGWGYLNVAPLLADSPVPELLRNRLVKQMNRLFGYLHGVSESITMPGCVFMPAHGIEGLDNLNCRDFSPEAYGKVAKYLAAEGYKLMLCGTYYDACEAGWAPAPTNEVQKAIWDKIHQLPKDPIRIRPETEKVRD